MGSGLSIPEMKLKITEELDEIYKNNEKSPSVEELKKKLDINNLSEQNQKYAKDNESVMEHYENEKKKILERHSLVLLIHIQATLQKAKDQMQAEEYKNNVKKLFASYVVDKYNDELAKQDLENKLNQTLEQNKKDLEEMKSKDLEEIRLEKERIIEENKKLKEELENHKKQVEDTFKNYEELKNNAENHNKKIQEMLTQHTKEMNDMKLENEKKLKENENNIKKEFEGKIKAQQEEMDKRIKDAKSQFEKEQALKEKALLDKKKELRKQFDDEIEAIKKKKIKQIFDSLKEEDKICLEEINKFTDSNLKKFAFDLIKTENMQESAIYHLNSYIEESKSGIKNVEHLNIILVGPSGVGKSTLIKSLLKVNLKTGYGSPQTQNIEFHTSKEFPILRLADSKGIEKNSEADIYTIRDSITNFINQQIETNDPDKFIHCVWYCFSGTRLEGSEVEILKLLSQQYTSDTLPVIIVLTRAISQPDIKNAKNYIHNDLKLDNEFIDILSEADEIESNGQMLILPPKNLDKLIEISLAKSMKSFNSACFEGKLNEIKRKIQKKFEDLMNKLKIMLESKAKESLSKLNEKSDITNFYDEIKNIIFRIISCFFFLDPEVQIKKKEGYKAKIKDKNIQYELSTVIRNKIDQFISQYFEHIINSLKKQFQTSMDNYSNELTKEIIENQFEFNQRNQNLLEFDIPKKKILAMCESYILNETSDKIRFIALKNALLFLQENL